MSRYAPSDGRAPVLAELVRDRQRLEVWCCRCHRQVLIDPDRAVELLGANTTFPMAKERLVCSACGARGRDKWIHVRPSVEDFYARLEGQGGLRMPGQNPSPPPPPTTEPPTTEPPAQRPTHPRRARKRRGRL